MSYKILAECQRHGSSPPNTWFYACECACGRRFFIRKDNFKQRKSDSCGCTANLRLQRATRRYKEAYTNPKHPLFGMYSRWRDVVQRCRNPAHKRYAAYGGRGILLCDRWTDFEVFLEDMGPCPPGLTLERDENDGNYEPGNCRWASLQEQAQNRRGGEATSARMKEFWRLQKAGLWPEGKNKRGR